MTPFGLRRSLRSDLEASVQDRRIDASLGR